MLATVLKGELATKQSIEFLTQFIEKVEIYEEEQANGQWLKSIEFKLPIISKDMRVSLDNGSQIDSFDFLIIYCNEDIKL